jgi:myo-inositol-1(or 4)-monophosphatase
LLSWDTAAGVLMVREAGGSVKRFDGEDYQLGDRELLASNARVYDEMQGVVAKVQQRTASSGNLPEGTTQPQPK